MEVRGPRGLGAAGVGIKVIELRDLHAKRMK
jgi:hypothetical protein